MVDVGILRDGETLGQVEGVAKWNFKFYAA